MSSRLISPDTDMDCTNPIATYDNLAATSQLLTDLAAGHALGHQLKHLDLTPGQSGSAAGNDVTMAASAFSNPS